MKKFVNRVCIFSSIVLLLGTIIDIGYSEVLIHSNERRFESWYDLMHGKINADVVINGNSRAWVQFCPQIIDSVLETNSYNLGFNGSTINRQIRKYRLFRKYNKPPKLIIQNIGWSSLRYEVGYEREQFFPYFLDPYIRKEFYETEPVSLVEKYVPLVRYRGVFNLKYLKSQPRYLEKGYRGSDRVWDGKQFSKIDSLLFSYNKLTVEMFDDFLHEVTDEGIKVLFVYAPMYKGVTAKITNLNEVYMLYQEIANKYNIPILDYTNMKICSDTTYFYNAMHLNRKGAELFSDSLANDIKHLHLIE